jgi:hypothetical protein
MSNQSVNNPQIKAFNVNNAVLNEKNNTIGSSNNNVCKANNTFINSLPSVAQPPPPPPQLIKKSNFNKENENSYFNSANSITNSSLKKSDKLVK